MHSQLRPGTLAEIWASTVITVPVYIMMGDGDAQVDAVSPSALTRNLDMKGSAWLFEVMDVRVVYHS